jgi:sugar transferase EpsL
MSLYDPAKRVLDLLLTLLAAWLWLPIIGLLALLVRGFIGAPVFFKQVRPGHNGKRDAAGTLLPDGQRLTAFGRFLRASSLDELPEVFNVLRGDMSLVGPRPLLMQYLDRYTPEQARRHEVRPGVTGWAQVHGRNAIAWEERFRLDVWYVDHRSFWLDIKIIFLTLKQVVLRHGISALGEATMPEFRGTDKN